VLVSGGNGLIAHAAILTASYAARSSGRRWTCA
jgi:hypothetical protein